MDTNSPSKFDTTDDGPQPTDERGDGPTQPKSTAHAPRISNVD